MGTWQPSSHRLRGLYAEASLLSAEKDSFNVIGHRYAFALREDAIGERPEASLPNYPSLPDYGCNIRVFKLGDRSPRAYAASRDVYEHASCFLLKEGSCISFSNVPCMCLLFTRPADSLLVKYRMLSLCLPLR